MPLSVECGNCGNDVELPSGLLYAGVGDNPSVKGVSCPWCYEMDDKHTIPAAKVQQALNSPGI